MTINDKVFGELEYEYGWGRDFQIDFLGEVHPIYLFVDGKKDGVFSNEQYTAYNTLMEKWSDIHPEFLPAILTYYQKRRSEIGYDVEENEEYPPIKTIEELLPHIHLVGIIIPHAGIFDGRYTTLTFDCTWDEENGVGIRLLNEEIVRIGAQDVAF